MFQKSINIGIGALAVVFICLASCVVSKKDTSPSIHYVVFGSLEDYLESRLKKVTTKPGHTGIIIDTKLTRQMSRGQDSVSTNIVELGIVEYTSNSELIDIFNSSDRHIRIGKNCYPVYIMYLENLFDSGEFWRDRSYCRPPLPTDLYEVVRVDFKKKRFYTE